MRAFPRSAAPAALLALALVASVLVVVGCRGRPTRRPSVVLVTLDTTRQDRFGIYGDPAVRTPEFDALARGGVLLRNAFVDASTTLPSHATMMTGSISLRHGVRLNGAYALPREARTLAESFSDAGYACGAVVSSAALASAYGLDQGFRSFDDVMPDVYEVFDPVWTIRARRVAGNQRRAHQTNEAARKMLADLPGPAFLWVHYIDAHQPDDPPFPWNRLPVAPYSAEIACVDRHMGQLLRDVEAAHGSTVVAVIADHGESTGEHRDDGHGLFLYDSVVRVPFAVRGPHLSPRIVSTTVTNADLAPILAAAAGLSPELYPDGADRLADDSVEPAAVFGETLAPTQSLGGSLLRTVRAGKWKYVHAPRPELYDLDADPREIENLHDREPDVVAQLRGQLESFLLGVAADPPRHRAREIAVDERRREQFAALGYIVVGAPEIAVDLLEAEGVDPKDLVDVFWALSYIDDGLIEKARPRIARFWSEHGSREDESWAPLLARAHYCEAVFRYADGRMEDAVESIRRSLRLDPGFEDPRLLLRRLRS